jgi:hypothetical protein
MWLKLPETEIVGIADADAQRTGYGIEELQVERGFADYRQMLAETKPDIIAVGPREISEHRRRCARGHRPPVRAASTWRSRSRRFLSRSGSRASAFLSRSRSWAHGAL